MRRPYLWFRDEFGNTEGLTGPFINKAAAQKAMDWLVNLEKLALEGLDLDSVLPSAQCIFAPYHSVQVMELSPEEIGRLT